jgi:formylmethanofuran dehydrogenase subunit E
MKRKEDRGKRRRYADRSQGAGEREARCTQCGEEVAPLEALLSPVCGRCVRKNHSRAVGR